VIGVRGLRIKRAKVAGKACVTGLKEGLPECLQGCPWVDLRHLLKTIGAQDARFETTRPEPC